LSFEMAILGVAGAVALIYLVIALVRPEAF
jgi:hypothetical protein